MCRRQTLTPLSPAERSVAEQHYRLVEWYVRHRGLPVDEYLDVAVFGYRRRRDTNAYYAAMYLLTSNDDIYRRTANCFCKDGIEFGYAEVLEQCRNM